MKAFVATLLCVNAALADPLEWRPLDADRLDELRGGFDTGELHASFGIERATYVNGELVVRVSVEIPDIGAITPEQASALDQAMNGIVLIQNGPNNSFDTSAVAAGATVIQNTLDDQHIVTLTTMSADVNTLAHFQGLNVNESLQQALNRGVGMR